MRQKRRSEAIDHAIGILMSVFIVVTAAQIMEVDLTTFIFGAGKESAPPSQQIASIPSQQASIPAPQAETQTDPSGYQHYTDKNGNEVVVVPARYEAPRAEPAPIQAAPQQVLSQRSPLPSQQVIPATVTPTKAAPPKNLALVAMNAANGNTRMNVFESCRCSNGIATKGDSKEEVLEKCAQPASNQHSKRTDCDEIWLYNFGANEFMQGVCFSRGRVSKVLSLDYGY
ncbi:DUF2845 domain-containing protein [Geoanaerobacter pelophilus]|uniref:DUF2845 domain-containing protein n=1 Tax=Geoanaerobacter pelophilus TaxID=60036 RepID=UPI000A26A8DD|nr:DUF2845 domain-containing protein [Geoanaerobacter pelophilus]